MDIQETAIFAALFKNSRINALIRMNTGGIIQSVNPAFTSFFGYANADLEGRHFSVLFTPEDRAKGKPEQEIEKVLLRGQADDKNFMVHKNGDITWVSGESILIEDEAGSRSLLKMFQDIHQQKESEASLSRAHDFNENILNAIEDFVIILNKSMQVLKYNPAFSRLFTNAVHLPITDFAAFIRPYDRQEELYHSILRVINTGRPFNHQAIEIITAGGERVFDLSCQPIFTRELQDVVLLVGHDITIQKRLDTEREDLMGFVAHELRNPIASLIMGNDLMSIMIDQAKPGELQALLHKNRKHMERLNKMVAELYDAAKISGGVFQLTIETFHFDEMVQEAVETFQVLQPSYHFTIEGKAGVEVRGDRYRLQQVVTNYLANAIKYSDGDREIIIRVSRDKKQLVLAVEDRGLGISPEIIPHIFDRFFRAEKTRNLEGIGLGLYLCRRILHAHQGKVWVESEEGKGSTFFFSLPLDQ